MKDLANCKMQLENKESEDMKATVKLEIYNKMLAKLSTQLKQSEAKRDKYVNECKKSQAFISMLESEYEVVNDELVRSIRNREETLQTVYELEVQLVMMKELENEALEKTILTDYYQRELMQAKELLIATIETMHDEGNRVCNLTLGVNILKAELIESTKREVELEVEVAMLKSELHMNRSRIAAAEAAEARAMSRQSEIYLAVQELAVEVEKVKKEKYGFLVEKDRVKEELDSANDEISELKSALEEMRRRAEMAESTKSEIEERLRRWREKQRMRRAVSEAQGDETVGRNREHGKASDYEHRNASLQDETIFKSVPLSKFLDIKL